MKLLIVEDEEEISDFIKKGLEAKGYIVDAVANGRVGLQLALNNTYDVLLLDVYLPGANGFEIAEQLRLRKKNLPILVLTVEDSVDIKVRFLRHCDDYIVKPFSMQELVARVQAVSRRGRLINGHVLQVGDLTLDILRLIAMRGDKHIWLRNKEFALLEFLMRNAEIVLTRGQILERVWDMNTDPFTNTVDVHMRFLRKKIDDGFENKLIHTITGRGYKIADMQNRRM